MSAALDPLIAEKLAAFGRRWRRLVILRGICGGVITLLGAMTVVAFVDLLILLPDAARWALSALGYAATGAVVWFTCLRSLLHLPDPRELARHLEKAKPELREDLLSAVELGDSKQSAQWDSEVFRSLLQTNVAERMRDLRMDTILPNKLISLWLRAAAVALVVFVVLWLLPDLHFGQLMARAFAPMANVERVSKVKIRILEPSPLDPLVARGDHVPVLVEITGPELEKVVLETFPKGDKKGRDTAVMGAISARQFTATILVGTEAVEYRIRAGDAITRKHTIQSRARPQVLTFDKTYQFPAYARLKPTHVTEVNGDLAALEGSEVDLKLQIDQPVKTAELQIEVKGRTNSIPLSPAGKNLLTGKVPIHTAAMYRVHLVADTGFDNKFSPQYEIRPIADLVPRVTIDAPSQDAIVPADEVIALRGTARDDLSVSNVTQRIQVNDGPWESVAFETEVKAEVTVARQWDLLQLGVKPGDRVTTKLVAVDLKGNSGESVTVHLTISSPGFDAKRFQSLAARHQVQEALKDLRAAATSLQQVASWDAINKIKKGDELPRKQLALGAQSAAEKVEQELEHVAEKLKAALKLSRPGREASDLVLAGRVLSQLKNEPLQKAREQIAKIAQETETPETPNDLRETAQAAQRAMEASEYVQQAFTELLSADESDFAADNLNYLRREQQRLNERLAATTKPDAQTLEQLARRQAGAAKETKLIEDKLKELAKQLPGGLADRTKRIGDNLQASRADLEKALAPEAAKKDLATPSAKMQRGVEAAINELQPIEKELAQRADKARETLALVADTSTAKVERARQDVEKLAEAERTLAVAKAKGQPAEKPEAKVQEAKVKAEENWKAAVEQLKDRASLEEKRPDADARFVADTTKAAQALAALRAASQGDEPAAKTLERLKEVEKAFRALEGGHELAELNSGLKQLADQERWENKATDAVTTRPKDWNWAENKLKTAPEGLKKAGLPEAAAKTLAEAARSATAQEVGKEMADRQTPQRTPTPVADKAESLNAAVKAAQEQAQPVLQEAREALAKAAPAISETMAGLARATEKVEKATRAAEQSSKEKPAAAHDEANKLLSQQKDLGEQVEELKEALRRDANVQDFASKDARDRSRDADDAVAMLREPPPKAEEALREAAAAKNAAPALKDAAVQQKKLGDTLKQLAKHYKNLETGQPEASRAELRKAEAELGLKSGLDAEYAKAEKLMDLAEQSPEKILAELERELAQNETMRKELNRIADATLDTAKDTLQQAAGKERNLAKALGEAAKAQEKKNSLPEGVKKLAEAARKLANTDVPAISQEATAAKAGAQAELESAKQALQATANRAPENFNQTPEALAKQIGDLVKPLEQAGKDLKSAASKAGQVLKDTPPADPKAAAAQAAQGQANKAAEQVGQLAAQAKALAELANASANQLAQAAEQQKPIANEVGQAGVDIARSGRHETRLGTPQGEALQNVGKQTQAVAGEKIPATQKDVAAAAGPAAAKPAVDSAQTAVESQLSALEAALAQPATPAPIPPNTANTTPPTESKWLARALDRLDSALNDPSSPKAPEGKAQSGKEQPAQPQPGDKPNSLAARAAAAAAMAEAAKAQQQAMAAARADGNVPGEKPTSESPGDGKSGAKINAGEMAQGQVPELRKARAGEWGKLPPKLAQGLTEGQREGMAGEYRAMVDTYFKVIAERAKDKKP